MYSHAYSHTVHPHSTKTFQPHSPPQTKATCLPTQVLDVDHVRRSLGLNHLSSQGLLNFITSTAREALTHGQPECIDFNGQSYVRLVHNQMLFTLSFDCTTVVAIQWVIPRPVQDQTTTMTMKMEAKPTAISREVSPESAVSPPSPSVSSVLSVNGRAVTEDSAEYDQIVDQIVNDMDKFMMDDVARHYRTTQSTTPSISCIPPSPTPSQELSWKSCSAQSSPKMLGLAPPPPLAYIPSTEEIDDCPLPLHNVQSAKPGAHAIVGDALYRDLSIRFPGIWESKAHLAQMVHSIISQRPGRHSHYVMSWRIWSCTPFVIITESDGCTLADVFEERHFNSHYRHCMQSLARRYAPKPVAHSVSMSTQSPSMTMSSTSTPDRQQQPIRYHLIYIKPILERLAKVTGCSNLTESAVIQIVDRAIRCGAKRQISKRTFAFQWQRYTVIMSKSLKTILDVAWNGNVGGGEVVTVHPDVVSILAKKCPDLDYFAIQELARCAKRTGRFSVKKNEYRQQFTYAAGGYRIVFASNHSTIVEMQRL